MVGRAVSALRQELTRRERRAPCRHAGQRSFLASRRWLPPRRLLFDRSDTLGRGWRWPSRGGRIGGLFVLVDPDTDRAQNAAYAGGLLTDDVLARRIDHVLKSRLVPTAAQAPAPLLEWEGYQSMFT